MINPWLRTGPCSPGACVRAAASAAGTPRLAVRLLAAACVVLAGLPLALATCHARADLRAGVTRRWARLLLRALGLRLEITTPDA
ncbi:MAG: 1-acyl-sn-glycerol-3-phosphate acyltransferase, partial [Nonomuraea sp.]|nr:1-acyl-sn-glycerol-3-phosphate acyltransferase [Nonomuraea sp.]